MKAGKKLLAGLLSAVCVTACALGTTACGGKDGERADAEIYAVYQTYTAYAEARGGEVMSYEEWLASIKGDKGDKGETGSAGTNGTNGTNGKSAYEIAVENGFKGTVEDWLASLKGDKGDKGDNGETGPAGTNGTNGTNGTDGADGANGAAGVGIKDISVEYGTDEKGNQTVIYTFTMTDGSTIVKKVAMPKQIYSVSIHSGAPMLWLSSDVKEGRYNLANVSWYIEYTDRTHENIPLTADQIDIKSIAGAGLCEVTAKYGNFTDTFRVYIADSADDINFEYSYLETDVGYAYCEMGGQPDLSNASIYSFGRVHDDEYGEIEVGYLRPVTDDMLTEFDSSECGSREYSIEGVEGSIVVYVYADKSEKVDYHFKNYSVRAVDNGIPELYFDVLEEIRFFDADGNQFGGISEPVEENVKLTAEMITGEVDFTTAGEKTFAVSYGGTESKVNLTVYDPEVTLVRYIYIKEISQLSVKENAGNEEIASMLVGQSMYVQFFEEVNGSNEEYAEVTAEMIDFSSLDTSKPGMSYVTVTYKGYTLKIIVSVTADWSEAQLTSTLTGSVMLLALEGMPVTKIELYDNGFAKMYANVEGNEVPLNEMLGTDLSYTQDGGILTLNYLDYPLMAVAVEGEAFSAYKAEGGTEYTGKIMNENAVVTLYGNGCGIVVFDSIEAEFVIAYDADGVADGKLNIYPYVAEGGGYYFEFTIDGDKLIESNDY